MVLVSCTAVMWHICSAILWSGALHMHRNKAVKTHFSDWQSMGWFRHTAYAFVKTKIFGLLLAVFVLQDYVLYINIYTCICSYCRGL